MLLYAKSPKSESILRSILLLAAVAFALYAENAEAQTPPSAPTTLIATSPQHGQTKLQWQTPAFSGSQDITGYQYRQRANDDSAPWGEWLDIENSDMNTVETTLEVNTNEMPPGSGRSSATTIYRFQVRALNSDDSSGAGAASNEATLRPRLELFLPEAEVNRGEEQLIASVFGALVQNAEPSSLTFYYRITAVGVITGETSYESSGTFTFGGGELPTGAIRLVSGETENPFSNLIIEPDRMTTITLLPDRPNDEGFIAYSPDADEGQIVFVLNDNDEASLSISRIFVSNGKLIDDSVMDDTTTEQTGVGQIAQVGAVFLGSTPTASDIIHLTFTSIAPDEARLALSPDDVPQDQITITDAVNNINFGLIGTGEGIADVIGPIYVIGQDDDVDELAETPYFITLSSQSPNNPVWDSTQNSDLFSPGASAATFVHIDDDTAAVEVALENSARDATTEAGGTVEFTVRLASEPTTEVFVTARSDDESEGLVSIGARLPAAELTLTFNADNWDTTQTVTVTGQDDDIDETDNTPFTISFAVASGDPFYDDAADPRRDVTPEPLQLRNQDDDVAAILVALADSAQDATTEAGGTVEFTARLASEPTAQVVVTVRSDDESEGLVSIGSDTPATSLTLTFAATDWNTSQTVTVTGQDDDIDEPDNMSFTLSFAVASGDSSYDGTAPASLQLNNRDDDDTAGVNAVLIDDTTTEAGDTGEFTVALTSEPTAEVRVTATSQDPSEGLLSSDLDNLKRELTLTFNADNWATSQTVTVTGQSDDIDEPGDATPFRITFAVASSDPFYDGVEPVPDSLDFKNADDDSVPTQVADLQVQAGFETLRITWDAPLDSGTSPITQYVVSWMEVGNPGSADEIFPDASVRQYDIPNLENGQEYLIAVTAMNSVGESKAVMMNGTPTAEIGHVTGLMLEPADRALIVSWREPFANGGAPPLGYEITWSSLLAGQNNGSDPTSELTYTINGLAAVETTVSVIAVNADGASSEERIARGTPIASPSAVTELSVMPIDSGLIVSWGAPDDIGSANITVYTVSWEADGDPRSTEKLSIPPLEPDNGGRYSYTITGLDNGSEYTVGVMPTNGDNLDGPIASATSTPRTAPGDIPAASLTLTPGLGRIMASWGAVTDNGGAPPLRYEITWSSLLAEQNNGSATTSELTYTIIGLEGVATTVTVQAVNAADLRGGAQSGMATPHAAPSTVTGLAVMPDDNAGLTASWGAPADSGSSAITTYTLSWRTESAPENTEELDVDSLTPVGGRYSYTIPNLRPGLLYTVGVMPTNADNLAGPVESRQAIPHTAPGDIPAASFSLTPGLGSIMASWGAVTDDGGAPPLRYEITWSSLLAGQNNGSDTTSELTYTITGLVDAETTVSVQAINAADLRGGAQSGMATPHALPSTVTELAVMPDDNAGLTASWGAPADSGSSAITTYTISWRTESEPENTEELNVDSLTPTGGRYSYTIPNLRPGLLYTVGVMPTNGDNLDGPVASATSTPRTVPGDIPAASFGLTPGLGNIMASWEAVDAGGAPPLRYEITWESSISEHNIGSATTSELTYTITDLDIAETTVSVQAINAADLRGGAQSGMATPHALPSTVTELAVMPDDDAGLTASWGAPADSGSSAITTYTISWRTESAPENTKMLNVDSLMPDGDDRYSYTIAGLRPGLQYTVGVMPTNGDNLDGPVESRQAIPRTAPGDIPAASLTLTPGLGRIMASWGAVTDNGGAPPLRYEITWSSLAGQNNGSATTSELTYTIIGLEGVATTVTVQAVNAADLRGGAQSGMATPHALPSTVTELAVMPDDNAGLIASWGAPADSGSSAITTYTLSWRTESAPENTEELNVDSLTPTGGRYSYTIPNLRPGLLYTVGVMPTNADNLAGPVESRQAIPRTAPGDIPAASLALMPGLGSIMASWEAVDAGGAPPLRYEITWESSISEHNIGSATTSELTYTITDLDIAETTVSVQAINAADLRGGARSGMATPHAALSVVTDLIVTPGDAQLTVLWGAPMNNGGADITSYTISWQTESEPEDTEELNVDSLTPVEGIYPYTITGLTNGETYTVSVYATNALGAEGPETSEDGTPIPSALRLRLRVFLESALP